MIRLSLFFALLLTFFSCSRGGKEDPLVAQIKTRTMQTRSFISTDAKEVMKEVIAVLQDEGYIVKNISHDLGVLTAERDVDIEKFASKFWAVVFSGKRASWKKHSVIEMTSNVTQEHSQTKVRINFLIRVFDNLGRVIDVHQILEDEAYLDFFNKVQKGLLSRQ